MPPFTGLTAGLSSTAPIGDDKLFVWQWLRLFRDQETQLAATPSRAASVTVSAQAASIPTTPIGTDPLAAGSYRVSGYVRITAPGGTSSSLEVSISWVDGGVTCTRVLIPAVTGNTTATTGGGIDPIVIDGATPVSYSTTYASVAPGEMQYELTLLLEAIQT